MEGFSLMPFSLTSPSIPIDQIHFEPTGDEDDPRARLTAHIRIAGIDMHLEAWEVEDDSEGNQSAKPSTVRVTDFDSLAGMMDCSFETLEIAGREYVLVATPYGR
jgi:hypothetical protein